MYAVCLKGSIQDSFILPVEGAYGKAHAHRRWRGRASGNRAEVWIEIGLPARHLYPRKHKLDADLSHENVVLMCTVHPTRVICLNHHKHLWHGRHKHVPQKRANLISRKETKHTQNSRQRNFSSSWSSSLT